MRENLLRRKLDQGKPVVGIGVALPDPILTNALSKVGFDFILFDMEHGALERGDLAGLLNAIEASDTEAVVRVPWNDFVTIKRVLDVGVYNIVVPMVGDADAARRAVAAKRYPPQGIRGCGPWRASGYGVRVGEYLERANDQMGVIIQIEHIDAMERIEEIMGVEGVTGTYFGPADFGFSIGEIEDRFNPRSVAAMEKVLATCQKNGQAFGLATGTVENAQTWLAKGAKFVTVGSDMGFSTGGARSAFAEMKAWGAWD